MSSIKKLSLTSLSSFPLYPLPIHGLAVLILLYIIFEWGKQVFIFLLPTEYSSPESTPQNNEKHLGFSPKMTDDVGSVTREDVNMILGKLGIFCHSGAEKLPERFDSDDVSRLFGENEEVVVVDDDEVKGAFDVFDENRDGFIDERELQRVLCLLGMKEETELNKCRNMIMAFDENGDGKIDLDEFSRLF